MEKIIIKKDEMTLEIPVPDTVEKADIFTTASKIEKFVRLFNPENVFLSQGIRRDRAAWDEFHALGMEIIPASDFRNATDHKVFAFDPAELHCESFGDDDLRILARNYGLLLQSAGYTAVAVPPSMVVSCLIARAFA